MNPQTQFAFSRIAVINRGDQAMRLINAVREWNAEGRPGLRVIAVYTAADRHATFVREADEAVLIGPSEPDAAFAGSPYLDYAELERALRACRADAVWPGWGFVSEKAEFVELCDRLGITFIGPPAEVMRRLGDKIESKRLAEQAGVPLAPWSGGPVADLAAARAQAESIGYPLMVKATAGGDRGIRLVPSREQLDEAFERASSEASKTAGDATVFLEQAIRGGRHVEVQVVADAEGTVWTLGVRDCSVQRRNQKVIEESRLDRAGRRAGEAAARARRRTGPGRRVRQRRDGGVPVRAQPAAAFVPRGQHPAAGRAPGYRGHHRHGYRQAAAAHRGGRHAGRDRPGRAADLRARHRGQAHRRGPRARLRARSGPDRAPRPADRPGHQGRHRGGAGRRHPAAVRLHDRQGDRLGPGPRRSPGHGCRAHSGRPPR